MQETLLSPGVLARENDQSFITQAPQNVGAAIIGPTARGRVGIPQLVTTYSEYLSVFGGTVLSGSCEYSFLTDISAQNYFANGGLSLLVTRVQSGSNWSPSSASIANSGSSAFDLELLTDGVIGNSAGQEYSTGALANGTKDNIRWEIAASNTSSGLFTLYIRRGDDTTKNKSILETYPQVSLDPLSSNYISKVIGDQKPTLRDLGTSDVYIQTSGSYPNSSRYVRVKSVNTPTPNYLLADGVTPNSAYTSSMPLVGSGSFGGGLGNPATTGTSYVRFFEKIDDVNTQGLKPSDYTDAITLLSNKDDYQFNMISTPGLVYELSGHGTVIDRLLSVVEGRGDAIYPVDLVAHGKSATNVVTTAKNIDSSYASTYWPWCQITNPSTGQLCWVTPSTLITGVYAFNDKVSEPWFAPAGINRGGLGKVQQVERKLTNAVRDTLYVGKVNPIATFPGTGVVVYGQKTLQTKASALDRVNVRRLMIEVKGYLSQVARQLVFEQNTQATRNNFLVQANPYLDIVQQRQGLYAFKVVMDGTNNTAAVIDRNQLVGQIYLQPTKTAEFIILDFNLTPTGVEFV